MAEVAYTNDSPSNHVLRVAWSGLSASDTGLPFRGNSFSVLACAIQFIGVTGTVTLQSSNDGTNWVTEKDVFGNDITLSGADAMFNVNTAALLLRPSVAAGGSLTSALLLVRG